MRSLIVLALPHLIILNACAPPPTNEDGELRIREANETRDVDAINAMLAEHVAAVNSGNVGPGIQSFCPA